MTAAATPAGPRTVGEIMSRPPVTATADEPVSVAADRMREQSVGSVVVVDGDRAVGILTERDLVRLAAAGTEASTIADWMTPDPDSVAPDLEVTDAFASLAEHGYRHIPVVDDGRARRRRLDARPDAHRADPARRQARERSAARPRRRHRRRDDDR